MPARRRLYGEIPLDNAIVSHESFEIFPPVAGDVSSGGRARILSRSRSEARAASRRVAKVACNGERHRCGCNRGKEITETLLHYLTAGLSITTARCINVFLRLLSRCRHRGRIISEFVLVELGSGPGFCLRVETRSLRGLRREQGAKEGCSVKRLLLWSAN